MPNARHFLLPVETLALGAAVDRLLQAGRVVEFVPVRTKRKNRIVCTILIGNGSDGGGTLEGEGRGATAAAALNDALEEVDL